MIARVAGLSLLLLAAVGWATLVAPARRDRTAAQDEFARARDERQRLRLRIGELERKARGGTRVAAPSPVGVRPETVAEVRRAVLRAVDATRLSGVNLAVSAGRAPVGAKVRLAAEGPFSAVVPLTGHLVGGPSALVLERVRLSPTPGGVAAELDGFRLGSPR